MLGLEINYLTLKLNQKMWFLFFIPSEQWKSDLKTVHIEHTVLSEAPYKPSWPEQKNLNEITTV